MFGFLAADHLGRALATLLGGHFALTLLSSGYYLFLAHDGIKQAANTNS